MRVALVHDHLITVGGGERVLEVMHRMFPTAPIFTLFLHKRFEEVFPRFLVRPSLFQKIPGALRHYQWFLPFMPWATEKHAIDEFDLVISSASALAKGIRAPKGTVHLCYCHTPTRYLWTESEDYVRALKKPRIVKTFIPFFLSRLRRWDFEAAQRVDLFIANSRTVQKRIEKFYGKPAVVVYPPVAIDRFICAQGAGEFFLAGGRLAPYKRFDLTIEAFNRLGLPLKIFGTGPLFSDLRKQAKSNIEFLGFVDDDARAELYSRSIAFIHPHVEDLGLTAIESMASGRPVVAFAQGGATETIIEGVTGTFFYDQTWEALADRIIQLDFSSFDPHTIRAHARQFDESRFISEMNRCIERAMASRVYASRS